MSGRHTVAADQVNEITESGLALVGEIRETAAKRARLERINAGLEDADAIELERARSRVQRAKQELRDACEDLDRIEEINAQKAEIRAEMLALDREDAKVLDETAKTISTTAKAAGYTYGREELIAEGALKRIVASRRKLRRELSESEEAAV